MQKPIVSTLPVRQPKRKRIFAIRLTDGERAKIERLAKQLNLPDSFMARHFILEAVAHHSRAQAEDLELGSQDTETE
jgi:predicted transcriptional regulator